MGGLGAAVPLNVTLYLMDSVRLVPVVPTSTL